MAQEIRSCLGLFFFLVLLTGFGIPWTTKAIGQAAFPYQANGSLIEEEGHIIGSALIGQNFSSPGSFHGRPSAAGQGYDAASSSGSDLAASSDQLIERMETQIKDLREEDDERLVPVDLVTASGSGLDPDISVAAALYQAPRVSKERNLPLSDLQNLIAEITAPRTFGLLGEARVNVLALNRALDRIAPPREENPSAENPANETTPMENVLPEPSPPETPAQTDL